MRVIGLVAALMVLFVGSWAHFYYGTIVEELKRNHGLPEEDAYGPFDSVWGYFDSAWESIDSDSSFSTNVPPPNGVQSSGVQSSGVQANPHLVMEE